MRQNKAVIELSRCAKLSFVLILLLAAPSAALENRLVATALDVPSLEAFADFARLNTSDFTSGGSSVEVLPSSQADNSVTGGVFLKGADQTVIFDYKFNDNPSLGTPLSIIFNQNQSFAEVVLPATDDLWCRRAIYVPDADSPFQWSTILSTVLSSGEKILFDNFKVVAGRVDLPVNCFATPPPEVTSTSNGATLAAINALLLDDSSSSEPNQPGDISGRIALPQNIQAAAGGVELRVSTFPLDFEIDGLNIKITSDNVLIPQGQNSADYFIDLFSGNPGETRKLQYECLSGCSSLDITTGGFWSEQEGTVGIFGATDFPIFANSEVDITLEAADTFSGLIDLPGSRVTNGNEQFAVRVSESEGIFATSFVAFIRPDAGLETIDYSLGAPTAGTDSNWIIEISCLGCDPDIFSDTQYATSAIGGVLSTDQENAHTFLSDTDHSGINFQLTVSP